MTYRLDIHRQNEITNSESGDQHDWEGKYDIENTTMSGFLAQDVEKAAAEINYSFSGITRPKNANGLYSLQYGAFVVPLVKAVQEQQVIIEKQQQQIELLIKRLEALEQQKQ